MRILLLISTCAVPISIMERLCWRRAGMVRYIHPCWRLANVDSFRTFGVLLWLNDSLTAWPLWWLNNWRTYASGVWRSTPTLYAIMGWELWMVNIKKKSNNTQNILSSTRIPDLRFLWCWPTKTPYNSIPASRKSRVNCFVSSIRSCWAYKCCPASRANYIPI